MDLEPLLHENTIRLVDLLLDKNLEVLIETNGTFDIGKVNDKSIKIVESKIIMCPGPL